MRVSGEFFIKAIDDKFSIELEVNGEYAGLVVKQGAGIYACVKNGVFMAVEQIFKRSSMFVKEIVIDKNKKVVVLRG